jgi:hypothetical protein
MKPRHPDSSGRANRESSYEFGAFGWIPGPRAAHVSRNDCRSGGRHLDSLGARMALQMSEWDAIRLNRAGRRATHYP